MQIIPLILKYDICPFFFRKIKANFLAAISQLAVCTDRKASGHDSY